MARLADATLKDNDSARHAMQEARLAVAETKALCDVMVAERLEREVLFQPENWDKEKHQIHGSKAAVHARKVLAGLSPLHFPIAFPEVFLRRRPGFDVILGNPPWQEATVEEHAFWARHFPGLRGLAQREAEREWERLKAERPDLIRLYETEVEEQEGLRRLLGRGAYPGMGTGDPDLYKAFCWRFWTLSAADRGRIGVVLPRSALSAKGSEIFRKEVFAQAADVDLTMLLNRGGLTITQRCGCALGPFVEPELSREAERCPEGFTAVVDEESGVLWFLNDRHLDRMMQTGRYVLVNRPAA